MMDEARESISDLLGDVKVVEEEDSVYAEVDIARCGVERVVAGARFGNYLRRPGTCLLTIPSIQSNA